MKHTVLLNGERIPIVVCEDKGKDKTVTQASSAVWLYTAVTYSKV